MTTPIIYEAKSDRELLVVVAQSINSLNERTEDLCRKVNEHELLLRDDRNKLSEQEIKVMGIIADNVIVAKETAKTLEKVQEVLEKQSNRINKLESMSKAFWWMVGLVAATMTGVVAYVIKHVGFPIG